MRVFAVLVAFVTVVVVKTHPISHEDKEKLFRYHKDCLAKTGVEENLVEQTQEGQFPEEPKLKEYFFCLSRNIGAQNEAGELQVEVIKKKLYDKHAEDEAEYEKLINKCIVQKDTATETAYNLFRCYRENSSSRFLFYIISISEEKLQKLNEYRKECLDETKVDIKLVEDARKGQFSDNSVFKQYLLCLSKKCGIQNADGAIQRDVIKEKLTEALKDSAKAQNLVDVCVSEKETPEDTALAVVKCLTEKTHLNILQPIVLPPEESEKLKAHHRDCLAQTSVDEALIEAACKGDFSEDTKLMEYFLCVSKKAGFQNEEGEIQKDILRQKLNEIIKDAATAEKLIEKCAVNKDTPQNTAFSTVKCYYENTPNHISIFQIVTISEKKKQKLIKYNTECQTESGVEPETLEQAKKGKFSEDEKFKKHLFCFYRKLGIQNESGELQKEVLSRKVNKVLRDSKLSEQLTEKCAIQRDTPENTAYGAFTCYYENSPSHFNVFALF